MCLSVFVVCMHMGMCVHTLVGGIRARSHTRAHGHVEDRSPHFFKRSPPYSFSQLCLELIDKTSLASEHAPGSCLPSKDAGITGGPSQPSSPYVGAEYPSVHSHTCTANTLSTELSPHPPRIRLMSSHLFTNHSILSPTLFMHQKSRL